MMKTEKTRAARRRRAFLAGIAQAFDARPHLGAPLVYGDAGRKKDAENLARDWKNIGGDLYKSMRHCKNHGF